ncbi:MAG: aminomethyl-transferring glycine dehydrogenase subunit GcvPA [Alicyclobacillus herbarius]|uniref:aminomethyl-transferring glycine dehydrogenase subunit GcvPA n=1 Tax=Alicyclobacillus herbarius TaxID=122960 RepID=UPI002353BCBD|nr:aminomethyl-transferring glycine dehydrogenase subunit GcvPA [Alicyclobacillus herbarius]MCL6631485.1 aminomethyl-transferring glycine dehydrogenase subunit GcvPA [Alicyclobacillus herbarius]
MTNFSYLPHTERDCQKMMETLGIKDVAELFADIPETVRLQRDLNLPKAMSEIELNRHMQGLAAKNRHVEELVSFLGAGAYEHYQPSVIDAIVSRSEFYTSYTQYQPEVSQGMLQAIFEYQTLVAELTGMDLANASMYDGPTALGEAGMVACTQTRRNRLLIGTTVHPEYCEVTTTYAGGQSVELVEIPHRDGRIDLDALARLCDQTVAGVLVQYPNFFGQLEDLARVAELAHEAGALLVVSTYPIALGLLEPPGNFGADIVVAEGQSLGNPLSFGGPYLGIMAARKDLMRRLPGRIVGETTDAQGRRGYVLTLQAREQHIRREKASSNICSNQALNALAATVFLAYMGPQGMRELALQNYHKAHYLEGRLCELDGISRVFSGPFFNEFVVRLPKSAEVVQNQLLQQGYLFGLHLGRWYPEFRDCVLVNVTEMRTREEMDTLVRLVKEALV